LLPTLNQKHLSHDARVVLFVGIVMLNTRQIHSGKDAGMQHKVQRQHDITDALPSRMVLALRV
jgi:hypothetical protein